MGLMKKIILLAFLLCLSSSLVWSQVTTSGGGGSSAPVGSFNVLPSVVSTGAVNVIGAGTSFTGGVAAPASIVDGNVLVLVASVAGANSETWTPPAGFTQIGSTVTSVAAGKVQMAAWCKVAASESGTYALSFNNGTTLGVAAITQLSGTNCTPDNTPGTATANAATITLATTTTTKANDLIFVLASRPAASPTLGFTTPETFTQSWANNGTLVSTSPNGSGNTPSTTLVSYVTSTLAASAANDFVGMIIAFAPTVTSTTTPFVANSSTAASTSGGINASGAIQASGNIQADTFIISNGGVSTDAHKSFAGQLASGAIIPLIQMNVSNAMVFDPGQHITQLAFGGGIKGGARMILSSGDFEVPSQDASQDLQVFTVDNSNNLKFGCTTAACTGQTQEADLFLNAQTAHLIHNQINVVDRLTIGDTKNLTSGAAATILSIPLAADQTAGGSITWSSLATDTVNHLNCSTSGTTEYSAENSAGVFVTNVSTLGTSATACTATLTNACTFALTSANPALLQVTCTLVNMASPTSYVFNYNINHLSGQVPTF